MEVDTRVSKLIGKTLPMSETVTDPFDYHLWL